MKSKDYRTVVKLLCEDKDSIFIFTSGNSDIRYVRKEDLYNEAKNYLSDNIFMCDLEKAITEVRKRCKTEVVFVVRKFLCVWRCFKCSCKRGK